MLITAAALPISYAASRYARGQKLIQQAVVVGLWASYLSSLERDPEAFFSQDTMILSVMVFILPLKLSQQILCYEGADNPPPFWKDFLGFAGSFFYYLRRAHFQIQRSSSGLDSSTLPHCRISPGGGRKNNALARAGRLLASSGCHPAFLRDYGFGVLEAFDPICLLCDCGDLCDGFAVCRGALVDGWALRAATHAQLSPLQHQRLGVMGPSLQSTHQLSPQRNRLRASSEAPIQRSRGKFGSLCRQWNPPFLGGLLYLWRRNCQSVYLLRGSGSLDCVGKTIRNVSCSAEEVFDDCLLLRNAASLRWPFCGRNASVVGEERCTNFSGARFGGCFALVYGVAWNRALASWADRVIT